MEQLRLSLPQECLAKLEGCTSLPTPPKVALQLIELVKNPEIEIEDVVRVLQLDPALSAKILRLANSPFYAHEKKVSTLQKAIMLIGLNGILSLALSFSLVKSLKRENETGLDQNQFWRRALISGSAGLTLGHMCNRSDQEELFMASFIQDLGMLVLEYGEPSLYTHPDFDQMSHQKVLLHEREHFGADHPTVGTWLLKSWNFPEHLLLAVRFSDDPSSATTEIKDQQFFHCVGFSGTIADISVSPIEDDELFEISQTVESTLGLPALAFLEVLKKVKEVVQESAPLFEIDCKDGFDPDATLERAKDLMAIRNIMLDQKMSTMAAKI